MEQMETAQRLVGCSFGVSGVPLWGKLKALMGRSFPAICLGFETHRNLPHAKGAEFRASETSYATVRSRDQDIGIEGVYGLFLPS